MEGILLAALALLSVPVLLIVILVKVCGLENKVADLIKKVDVIDFTQRHVTAAQAGLAIRSEPSRAERVPRDTEKKVAVKVSAAKENVEKPLSNSNSPTPTSSPSVPPAPLPRTPYEPTAFDMFWMRIEDWLAVRGDFAPKGMTHEFAFATRWLIRVGAVLIIGAIIYFVKLSIDRGWMGPTGRVAATLFWGMVGCVGGSWLVKKGRYSLLGHAIAALGVVAL